MTAVLEPRAKARGAIEIPILPALVFVDDEGLIHAPLGGKTFCCIGPVVASKLFPPRALHGDREWCPRCFPGPRCSLFGCHVPCGDAGECFEHLAQSIASDKAIERWSE